MNRATLHHLILTLVVLTIAPTSYSAETPNIVVIYCDDLGYGDLGCYGAKDWTTPNIDRLAKNGLKFTDFYVSQPVCSASRTSLLTGCYANRVGIHGALGPTSRVGISEKEVTLGQLCKSKGYATAMVGKWHLGHHPQFLPTRHGFDRYYGLPYSNDMWPHHPMAKSGYPNLPLFENERIINKNVTAADQCLLTKQYTEQSVKFIQDHAGKKPFFLYLAHSMPHVPLHVSDTFKGSSKQGLYGDVIQEIDWSVGQIVQAIEKANQTKNTLVIFASDNGPWLSYGNHAGSRGPLREGKGSVWEGGVRVPCVAQWPGKIPAESLQKQPAMTIDLFPTIARLIDAPMPKHTIDGKDIWPLLTCAKDAKSPHDAYYFYYNTGELQAIRSGKWKLFLPHTARMIEDREPGKDGKPMGYKQVKLEQMLYDLDADIGETKNIVEQHPEIVKQLLIYAETARDELGDTLTKRIGKGTREPGRIPAEK